MFNSIRSNYLAILIILTMGCVCTAAANAQTNVPDFIAQGLYDEAADVLTQDQDHGLHALIAEARAKKLAEHPLWRVLMLYKPNLLTGVTSEVDGPDFFMSRTGKTDPQAELDATLASFFSERLVEPLALTPQCRFPARYVWLKQQLNFGAAHLADQACPRLDEFVQSINADSVTVVFPAEHPNSPSSMFGHTLLRFDRPNQNKQTRMLAYTVTYAAIPDTENNLLYALKGITGSFKGKFAVIPYYMKLREYTQMENRDVWEYRLNLDKTQVDFILLHAYELALTYFDYYFFTENCSYHLLSLLEAALPTAGLTDYPAWVIPIDTVKRLKALGLITQTLHYPAQAAVVRERRSQLAPEDRALAMEIFRTGPQPHQAELAQLNDARKAGVLDLAYEYRRHTKIAAATAMEAKLTEEERTLLLVRSAIPLKSPDPQVLAPAVSPDNGHGTTRLAFGAGRVEGASFMDVGFRAAYHDLLDPTGGYSSHAQLEFFNVTTRYFPDTQRTTLADLTLIDIVSLEPRDEFFGNVSWRLHTGWHNIARAATQSAPAFTLNGGFGLTQRLPSASNSYVYAMLDSDFEYSHNYAGHFWLGAGALLGWSLTWDGGPRTSLTGRYLAPLRRANDEISEVSLKQSFPISPSMALELDVNKTKRFGEYSTEACLKLQFYF